MPADVELESEKQQIVVNLPAQFDEETGLTLINDGGPLFRLKATNAISLLTRSSSSGDTSADAETDLTIYMAHPVPHVAQPPTIDGNLSELVWQTAARPLSVPEPRWDRGSKPFN